MQRTLVSSLICAVLTTATVGAQTVNVTASRDNTLYEDSSGGLSNGSGDYLFAGRTNFSDEARRALLYFDLSSIPSGSTVLTARLHLTMSMTIADDTNVTLHRMVKDWGEGASDALNEEGGGAPASAGDATWLHQFFPTDLWDEEGGEFVSLASAVSTVDDVGSYQWTSASAVLDVQGWVDDPASNFGWIVRGDELQNATAKRFNSREHPDTATRPMLQLLFATPESLLFLDGFESGDASSWSQTSP